MFPPPRILGDRVGHDEAVLIRCELGGWRKMVVRQASVLHRDDAGGVQAIKSDPLIELFHRHAHASGKFGWLNTALEAGAEELIYVGLRPQSLWIVSVRIRLLEAHLIRVVLWSTDCLIAHW